MKNLILALSLIGSSHAFAQSTEHPLFTQTIEGGNFRNSAQGVCSIFADKITLTSLSGALRAEFTSKITPESLKSYTKLVSAAEKKPLLTGENGSPDSPTKTYTAYNHNGVEIVLGVEGGFNSARTRKSNTTNY